MQARVDHILAGLDERQRAAATLGPGPAQIIAPAGSGKTATLVARIGVLVAAGVPAARILVVTFNRDAATELAQRIQSRLGITPGADGPEVRTLHALARQVVLDAGRPVRLRADRLPLLRRARRQILAALPPGALVPSAEEMDALVSAAILEGRPYPQPVSDVIQAYRRLLTDAGSTDFDLLLADALGLLRRDAAMRQRWQDRFTHVLVDEFQDVDASQFDLVSMLAEPECNLFVVGDDDQTIYAWRLADVRRILDFPVRYPTARRVVLGINYRCPPQVVTLAARLIEVNQERVAKRLTAARPPAGLRDGAGPVVSTWPLRGPDAADRLTSACVRFTADGSRLALLARTRAELVPMALSLLRADVRHASTLATPLESPRVATLVDDLRTRPGGDAPFEALRRLRAGRGWRRTDANDFLGEEDHAALDAALGWAASLPTIAGYLTAFDAARTRLLALRDPAAPIELVTVHGAKGREWDTVVVVGFEAERFPNRRALVEASDPARALEEERRLAYVALTRAHRRLVLAFDPERPSPFLAEMHRGRLRQVRQRVSSPTTTA